MELSSSAQVFSRLPSTIACMFSCMCFCFRLYHPSAYFIRPLKLYPDRYVAPPSKLQHSLAYFSFNFFFFYFFIFFPIFLNEMPKQTYPGTYICTSIHWKHLNTLKSADRKVYTVSIVIVLLFMLMMMQKIKYRK